jgi:hypothetical protein
VLGISKPTVTRLVHRLEKAGHVAVTRRPRGPERTNLYFLPRAVRLPGAPHPRSREGVQAICLKLGIPFQERYVRRGREHLGIDEEAWVAAQRLRDADWSAEELVAFLERNLAMQGRSPEAVAARRRAS